MSSANGARYACPKAPLPLQSIETIDQPRDARKAHARQMGLPFEEEEFTRSAHRDDWRNMLVWGDNKLVLATLLQDFRGEIDLIYIDPPFDVGADFTMQVEVGEEGDALHKEQSILEAVAYRDTWGKGTDSYLHMISERLTLMRELLSANGSIYVHCDWRMVGTLRVLLDEIFPELENVIAWKRSSIAAGVKTQWRNSQDFILFYSNTGVHTFNPQHGEYSESSKKHFFARR